MNISVAEKIRIIANRKNITMGMLAELTGQTRQNLSNKMSRGNFTEKDIAAMAKALGCEAEVIFILPDGERI
jgi:phage tail tape-measure protein